MSRIELIDAFSFEVIEQIQRETLDKIGRPDALLFQHRNSDWMEFKNKYQEGDELYGFKDTYGTACGYVLVRGDRGVAWFIVGAST